MYKSNYSSFSCFTWGGSTPAAVSPYKTKSRKVSKSLEYTNETVPTSSLKLSKNAAVHPTDQLSPRQEIGHTANCKVVCDKCDGGHDTSSCPYYKKDREKHPDAQKNFYKKLGGKSKLPGAVIRNGRVIRQPGDGSCLFHSMSYGLRDGSSASSLRREVCTFIKRNPNMEIADTPLSDWIHWDSGESVGSYTRRMSMGAWGGGIEMAAVSLMRGVNIHVYERSGLGFTRISAFDHPNSPETRQTIRVLYCGGVHYDALSTS
mmetsp:Transcript_16718/g.25113  ORF Transcript_16718/g.25113 Transcript_16718/m.25113 type:complete len:261 (+) Transcript_16718:42-824(+)